MNTLEEVAQRVHESLGSPDVPVIGFVQSILRFKIGELNNLIDTTFAINASNGAVTPTLGEAEYSILEAIYFLHYYNERTRNALNKTDISGVIEVTHTVLHKNEVGILVWTLLCLTFFNSLMQEINSLVVLFF